MRRSQAPVRVTTAEMLGIPARVATAAVAPASLEESSGSATALQSTLDESDPLLQLVEALRGDGFSGVVLSGPPGTSKSWYARELAIYLADGAADRVRFVQFHPSYQYEDFVESYELVRDGSYQPKARLFLEVCEAARVSDGLHVLVIDELSRSDAVRVFGEALTYLETSKRDVEFELSSGRRVSIPKNLFIVATMNPWDRGVDEIDMAFERRFAKIEMPPSALLLKKLLEANGVVEPVKGAIERFFVRLQRSKNEHARIGHAYFSRVKDLAALRRLWDHQLSFHFERAFRLNPDERREIDEAWASFLSEVTPPAQEGLAPEPPTTVPEDTPAVPPSKAT